MNRFLNLLALALFIAGVLLILTAPAHGAPPVDPRQPRPDLFSCGVQYCDIFNPTTQKAKATHSIRYRVQVEPGCSAGTIPADLEAMNVEARKVNFDIARDDFNGDFTVYINCGSEQIRRCGSVNVFCLNRGYPYNTDIDISDILSTYLPITRLSILLHEVMGHAVGSWNEQYQLCGASCNFAPVPNWPDFMGTGVLSRHGFEEVELGRWARTMYELQVVCEADPCWTGTVWKFSSGWSVNPSNDTWYDPKGRVYWTAREPWGGRCSPLRGLCWHSGATYYDVELGDPWLVVP